MTTALYLFWLLAYATEACTLLFLAAATATVTIISPVSIRTV